MAGSAWTRRAGHSSSSIRAALTSHAALSALPLGADKYWPEERWGKVINPSATFGPITRSC